MEQDHRFLFAALLGLFSLLIILLGWSLIYDSRTKFLSGTESSLTDTIQAPRPILPALRPTDPSTGSTDPRTPTIVVFSDFTCSYCRLSQGELIRAITALKKPVRVIWRDLPISSTSREAMLPALGGRCAHAQNKFWEFHDAVFTGKPITDENVLRQRAQSAGLDIASFTECVNQGTYVQDVQKDVTLAREHLIVTSPTFFVGNQPAVSGYVSANRFTSLIEQALAAR
jgi:protein-disulfide isomerase